MLKTLTLVLVICVISSARKISKKETEPIPENECHPGPTSGYKQFVVGYGSLMQQASKLRTDAAAGPSIPVRIFGFSRKWNAQGQSLSKSTTFLGIEDDTNGHLNGVIFSIPSSNEQESLDTLTKYDARESWYCRQKVPVENVEVLGGGNITKDTNADYWIYVNKPEFDVKPNKKYPIVQSYVDIFISGCMEIEQNFTISGFTDECIDSTQDWSKHWVNDRIYPRRPWIYEPKASAIDKALYARIPNIFEEIEIEG